MFYHVSTKHSRLQNNVNVKHFSKKLVNILVVILGFIEVVRGNRPPRFLIEGHSEIVLRLKEGPATPVGTLIYKLKGFDPDGDDLQFGIRTTIDSNILKIENSGNNEANLYLAKELDREVSKHAISKLLHNILICNFFQTKDEFSLVLTLTDNKLGEGNFVTQSLLIVVDDVNDNVPIFKPFQSALEILEESPPGILTTVEATDRDEGAYGQVVYYLQELDGDNEIFTISTVQGKGVIRLAGSLDFEKKSLYQLRVLAVDRANQVKYKSTVFFLNLLKQILCFIG